MVIGIAGNVSGRGIDGCRQSTRAVCSLRDSSVRRRRRGCIRCPNAVPQRVRASVGAGKNQIQSDRKFRYPPAPMGKSLVHSLSRSMLVPKISQSSLQEIREAFERYSDVVEESELRLSAKNTYLLHARQFVRWLSDEFEPGATIRGRRTRGPGRRSGSGRR